MVLKAARCRATREGSIESASLLMALCDTPACRKRVHRRTRSRCATCGVDANPTAEQSRAAELTGQFNRFEAPENAPAWVIACKWAHVEARRYTGFVGVTTWLGVGATRAVDLVRSQGSGSGT